MLRAKEARDMLRDIGVWEEHASMQKKSGRSGGRSAAEAAMIERLEELGYPRE